MKQIDIAALEKNIEATRLALRDGVLSINIWDRGTGLTLADWQGNPTSVALLTQLIAEIDETLEETNFAKLKDYFYIDLQDGQSLVVINHGDNLMQGWLIDDSKTNNGILLGMAVPNAIANIEAAKY